MNDWINITGHRFPSKLGQTKIVESVLCDFWCSLLWVACESLW